MLWGMTSWPRTMIWPFSCLCPVASMKALLAIGLLGMKKQHGVLITRHSKNIRCIYPVYTYSLDFLINNKTSFASDSSALRDKFSATHS